MLRIKAKDMNNVKNLNEYLDRLLECVRGVTPIDIKQKCLSLCQKYLSDIWLNRSVDDIEVKQLTGGLTNQLFYCKLINGNKSDCNEPQEVVLRLYGQVYGTLAHIVNGNQSLHFSITSILMSVHNLGPKLYGLFECGQIQAYYEHRHFHHNEPMHPGLLDQLARKLARVHAIEAPLKKKTNWLFDYSKDTIDKNSLQLKKLFVEYECKTLLNMNCNQEIQWIEDCVHKTNTNQVFSHNDFRRLNILVTKANDIILCDFDFSSYNYRGYDFASLFLDWVKYDPKYEFPDDSILKTFITAYIKESEQIFGSNYSDNSLNSVQHILKEAKILVLIQYINFALVLATIDSDSDAVPINKKTAMTVAETNAQNYFQLKKLFIDENAIEF